MYFGQRTTSDLAAVPHGALRFSNKHLTLRQSSNNQRLFQEADIMLQNVTQVLVSRNSESWQHTSLTVCGRSGRINGLSLP